MTRTETRRERLRREVTAEIVDIGGRQLQSGGMAAVSWRGIAREVGMNPASLYTYVDGMDDLFTRILQRSFERLASAVSSAADAETDPLERLLAAASAYRSWAIEHPAEFNLIYTDQLPGYVAPEDGPTAQAARSVDGAFIAAVADLLEVTPEEVFSPDHPGRTTSVYAMRALLHGFTSLEANHHAPYTGGSDEMLVTSLRSLLDDIVEDRRSNE